MDRGSQLDEEDEEDEDDKDDEEDEEDEEEEEDEEDEDEDARKRKRKRKATNIKSNNPHLAGGEKTWRKRAKPFIRCNCRDCGRCIWASVRPLDTLEKSSNTMATGKIDEMEG